MDEYVQYLVVNADLGMSAGKVGAQCGHGVDLMLSKYFELERGLPIWPPGGKDYLLVQAVRNWWGGNRTKIVKKASGAKFEKLKSMSDVFVVTDLGRTELEGKNDTVVSFWPMKKSDTPKELVRLRLL